ncbi:MAG: hypothetical protein CM1200mP1_07750 [Candidatus Neomarinimicrobiota bacterium]|nr:MAG: hypothetical protein CM1200mP1_07750 [Candidatus Neomarinimicrobiota bacterium]
MTLLTQKNIIVERDSLDNKYITLLEMYGNYEVPNMGNPSQKKLLEIIMVCLVE